MSDSGKNDKSKRRPLFLFGPGTVVIVVAAALFTIWQLMTPHKVQIERQVENSAVAVIRKPSAEQLLYWELQIQLTAEQKEKLKRIAHEERVAIAPVNAEIDKQIEKFNEFTTAHKSASLNDIETYRMPLSELSQKKRATQQVFVEQAMEVLSKEQRANADRLYETLVRRYGSHH